MTRLQARLLVCATVATSVTGGCVVVTDDDGDSLGGSASNTVDETGTGSSGASAEVGSDDADPTSASATGTTSDSPTTATGTTQADEDSTSDDGGTTDEGGGTIDVVLTGCDIDLGGTVVVSYNGSLGVASVYDSGATLSGSFQFDLFDGTGVYALSSQHRVDTGNVINLVDTAQGTWTNLDADALSGGIDTIGGTLTVHEWDPASGISDLELDGVSLRNVGNGNVCTIDGTIVTTKLYP
jgi:hypothetical protein